MASLEVKHKVPIERPNAIMLALQETQWEKLNTVANNLSNASTFGYKSQIFLSQEAKVKSKNKTVSFVKPTGIVRNLMQGSFHKTGNPLDISLAGAGYFMIQTNRGIRYTRNGQLTTNTEGKLMLASGEGMILSNGGSEIILPQGLNSIAINQEGDIYADGQFIDKIGVVTFTNEERLRLEGGTLLSAKEEAILTETRMILQGGLEESNVSPILESIHLIEILRLYENAQKIIDEYDQMQRKIMSASAKNV